MNVTTKAINPYSTLSAIRLPSGSRDGIYFEAGAFGKSVKFCLKAFPMAIRENASDAEMAAFTCPR